MCTFRNGGLRARLAMAGRLDMAFRDTQDWRDAVSRVADEVAMETGCEVACAQEFLQGLVPQNRLNAFVEGELSLGG